MAQMLFRFNAAACTMALLYWPAAHAVVLRDRGAAVSVMSINTSEIPTKSQIEEKWSKMDDFIEIMFMLACKWKHGKDVHGRAAEEATSSALSSQEVSAFKKELRTQNIQQLTRACGTIVGKGKQTCRQSCADRWGEAMSSRSTCDAKCVSAYAAFERSCISKAQNLEKVYAMKVQMADSREQCYRGWCEEFPTAWMKADAAAMSAEVDSQCAGRCSETAVQTRCERKFQLEVDFIRTGVESGCHANSSVTACFDQKKAAESTAYDSCDSTGTGTCESQYSDCQTQGKVESSAKEAEAFCKERKKMCTEQVSSRCLDEHKTALDKAKNDCEQEAAAGEETCVSEGLAAKETEVMGACKTQLASTCTKDCKNSCDTNKMNECLANLVTEHDPAQAFCEDFWRLLHESTEVDPMTGDPIVLLSRKA